MIQFLQDRRAMARLISQIENGAPASRLAVDRLYRQGGRARVIGITGAPGCGKSTLVSEIARWLRTHTDPPRVAIVAVDPTSPFSGGAILGDRLRMRDLSGDEGVFIRSMASRGALGGIASATADVVSVLDACGYGTILVETVGAGQLEVDVASVAQTVIVVEAPGAGDDIQAAKAGILEIADIIVVNKADREGAAHTMAALQSALDLAPAQTGHHAMAGHRQPAGDDETAVWRTPILKTSALHHEGIADVVAALSRHADYLAHSGEGMRRRAQTIRRDIEARVRDLAAHQALSQLPASRLEQLVAAVVRRDMPPFDAAQRIMAESVHS